MWDKHGALFECGRWANDKLVAECAVPLSLLPEKRCLSEQGQSCARTLDRAIVAPAVALPLRLSVVPSAPSVAAKTASLLFPDGGYFVGAINAQSQRHGFGRMFSKGGALIQFSLWFADQLQRRKALIIGNNKYTKPVSKLQCCVNDAIDIRCMLNELA